MTAPFDRPIAHRGLHDRSSRVIENSAAAFEAAIAHGFGIECDLQLCADGQLMVFHDPDLKRLTGREGSVHQITGAELGKIQLLDSADGNCPQTFAQFLGQIAGRSPLVVEIKKQPTDELSILAAQKAVEAVAAYSGSLVIKSFDPVIVRAVRKAGFRGKIGIITYGYNTPAWDGDLSASRRFVLRHLLHWPWTRFTFISCERTALGLPAVRLMKALGMKVMSWTVKEKSHAAAVMRQADQIVFEGFDPDS